MSSKIEISRELADLIEIVMSNGLHENTPILKEFREILAAPVVERQPGYVLAKQTAVEVPGQERKELGYTLFDGIGVFCSRDEVHAAIAELGLPLGWVSMTVDQLLPGYIMPIDAPPELAELQATIAQLTESLENQRANHKRLTGEAVKHVDEIHTLRTEIERLKGGQGEPEYWADAYDNTITAKHKSHNEKLGGAPLMVVERYTKPLYTSQPAPVSVEMSFDFEHPLSKEKRTVTLTKQDVFEGMEDYFYDKLAEQICQCESVGETNVVDCNCDEYVHDFEIVSACIDKVKELNQ